MPGRRSQGQLAPGEADSDALDSASAVLRLVGPQRYFFLDGRTGMTPCSGSDCSKVFQGTSLSLTRSRPDLSCTSIAADTYRLPAFGLAGTRSIGIPTLGRPGTAAISRRTTRDTRSNRSRRSRPVLCVWPRGWSSLTALGSSLCCIPCGARNRCPWLHQPHDLRQHCPQQLDVTRVLQDEGDMSLRWLLRMYRGQSASQRKPRIAWMTVRHSKYD